MLFIKKDQTGFISTGAIVIVIIGVGLFAFAVNNIRQNDRAREKRTATERAILDKELSRFSPPSGCSEDMRSYQTPNLDTISSFIVTYRCNQKPAIVYERIKQEAAKNSYHVAKEEPRNSDSEQKSIEFTSNGFYANYNINPADKTNTAIPDKASMRLEFYKR